jgi:hypothetical protein
MWLRHTLAGPDLLISLFVLPDPFSVAGGERREPALMKLPVAFDPAFDAGDQ